MANDGTLGYTPNVNIMDIARQMDASRRPQWGPNDWASAGANFADFGGLPSSAAGLISPSAGQAWRNVEQGGTPGSGSEEASLVAPGAYLGKAFQLARNYPKAAAALAGLTGAMANPAGAGEQPTAIPSLGPRPTATPEEAQEIARLQGLIDTTNSGVKDQITGINNAANTAANATDRRGNPINGPVNKGKLFDKAKADAATAQASADKLTSGYQAQLNAINNNVAGRQAPWDAAKAKFDADNQPVEAQYPNAVFAAKAAGLPISFFAQRAIGKYAPKLLPMLARPAETLGDRFSRASAVGSSMLAGGAAGAGEAAAVASLPQYYDSGAPQGSPAKNQADANSDNKLQWLSRDMGLEIGLGGLMGAIGTRYGIKSGVAKAIDAADAAKALTNPGTLAAAPAAEAAPAMSQADQLKAAYAAKYGPNAGTLAAAPPPRQTYKTSELKQVGPRSWQNKNGQFVRHADIEDLPSP